MSNKDSVIKFIEYNISKCSNSQYMDKDKYDFLNSIDFDFCRLCYMDTADIFKLYYSCFSNTAFNVVSNKFEFLREYLNRIKPEHFMILNDIYDFFYNIIMSGNPRDFYMEEDTYENMLSKFNAFTYPSKIKKFIIDTFKDGEKINFNAYNGFLNLCNSLNKITIVGSISYLIELGTFGITSNETPSRKKEIYNEIKKEYPELVNNINLMVKCRDRLKDENEKFEKNKSRQINVLEEALKNVNEGKKVEILKIEKFIDSDVLISKLLDYNNSFLTSEYEELLIENKKLKNNSISRKEVLLKELEFKIDMSKILVDDDELEYKLNSINKFFPEAKKYTNIVLALVNKISIEDFEVLKKVITDNSLEQVFVLENINRLCIKEEFINFVKNIELFKKSGFKVKDINKFDSELVFFDNDILSEIINSYLKYGVIFDNEISNYKFLYGDYSYIIDKFIEIGEYDFIIKNPSLICPDTEIIIKRCIFNKDINEPILNEQGKLIGNLRKESSFYISDKELSESVLENYEEFIPKDILDVVDSDLEYTENDIQDLKKYRVNNFVYDINGFIVSINKVKRFMSKVLNSDIKDLYTFNELLYYAIIYRYPKLVTRNNIINLRNILNIKTKTLN